MKLDDYIHIFLRRKWIVLVTALVTIATVAIGSALVTTYTATVWLRVTTAKSGSPDFIEYDVQYTDRVMGTYVEIANSSSVHAALVKRLGVRAVPDITVDIVPDSELLEITAKDADPVLAQNAVIAMTDILISEVPFRGTRVYVMNDAASPKSSSLQERLIYLMLALVVGVVGGISVALVFETLDHRLYSAHQIVTETGLSLLSEVPATDRPGSAAPLDSNPIYAEAVRRLAANIISKTQFEMLRTLVIVSAEPQEGKSSLTASLGMSLARHNRRVVLVDADLRLPTLHSILGLSNDKGLGSVLKQEISLEDALQETGYPGLRVLTSGSEPSWQQSELLASDAMQALLTSLTEHADMILIDSPAYLAVADAAMLAPIVDAVLLVTRRGQIQRASLQTVHQQLSALGVRLLGVVVNWAEVGTASRYRHYYGS